MSEKSKSCEKRWGDGAMLGRAQHFQNTFSKMFVDLGVPWNWLRNLRGGIVVPVVLSAVSD